MKLYFNEKLFCLLSILGLVIGSTNTNGKLMLAEHDGINDEYIVVAKCNRSEVHSFSHATAESMTRGTAVEIVAVYRNAMCGFSGKMSYEDAEIISKRDDVEYVEQDSVVVASDVTWGLDRIDQVNLPVDDTFEPFGDGSGVDAYVIDTGIYVDHNDFEDRAEWGYNSADNTDRDCSGHGTHVAGTIGGKKYGVAKKVNLIGVKVLNCQGSGTWTGIIAGIDWTTAEAKKRGRPSTANLSLGGGRNQAVNDAVKRLHESGVVTVVAAGNNNQDARNSSPASEPAVLTVGATTNRDARASFSNYGELVDIFAPGQSIEGPGIGSPTNIDTLSGTSMASPHVCGAAALYLSAGVDAADVPQKLIDGATPDKISNPGTGSPNRLLFLKPPSDDRKACEDGFGNCPFWAGEGFCTGKYEDYMSKNCMKSCDTCPTPEPTSAPTVLCEDKYGNCSFWAGEGFCNGKYADHMNRKCKKSCGTCSSVVRTSAPTMTPTTAPVVKSPNGSSSTDVSNDEALLCADSSEHCSGWAKENYCHNKHYKKWMHKHCRKSCGRCNVKTERMSKVE